MMPKKQIDGGDFFLSLLVSYREVSGRSYGETGGDRLWKFMEGYCTALASPRRIKNFLRDKLEARRGNWLNWIKVYRNGEGALYINIHGKISLGLFLTKGYRRFNRL